MLNWQAHAVSLLVVLYMFMLGTFLIRSLCNTGALLPPVELPLVFTHNFPSHVRRACEQLPHVKQSSVIQSVRSVSFWIYKQ